MLMHALDLRRRGVHAWIRKSVRLNYIGSGEALLNCKCGALARKRGRRNAYGRERIDEGI